MSMNSTPVLTAEPAKQYLGFYFIALGNKSIFCIVLFAFV